MQSIVDGLAARLDRATAIDDPQIHLLAYSAQVGETDVQRVQSIMQMRVDDWLVKYVYTFGIGSATDPVKIPGLEDLGMLNRWCFPVRCQGLLFGFLWILDADWSLSAEEVELCGAAAAAAGEILMRDRLLDDGERTRDRDILRGLLADSANRNARAYEQALEARLFDPQDGCCVLVIDGLAEESSTQVADRSAAIEHSLLTLTHRISPLKGLSAAFDGDQGVLLMYGPPAMVHRLARSTAEGRYAEARGLADSPDSVHVGVGSVEVSLAGARRTLRRARSAAQIAAKVDVYWPIAHWDDLGIYQTLSQLPGADEGAVELPDPVRMLLAEKNADQMVETLELYLDLAGSVVQCTEGLHLHRATLYHRLKRIETVTGMSLSDGRDRLLLHTGLKIARMQGQLPG